MNNIYVFEGLPGAGKTTIIRDIMNKFDFFSIGGIIDSKGNNIPSEKLIGTKQNFYYKNDRNKMELSIIKSKKKINSC